MADEVKKEVDEQVEATKPQYMTVEDYNKAMTAYKTRLSKDMEKSLAERDAKIEALLAAREQAPEPVKKEIDPEVAQLRKRLDDAEKARKMEAEARESEKQKRLSDEASTALRAALRKAGVEDEDLMEGAASMHERTGRVTRDENGRVGLKTLDQYGNEAVVPIDEGIKAWTGTSQGKKFLPPVGVEGSGTKTNKTNRPQVNGKTMGKTEAALALARLSGIKF